MKKILILILLMIFYSSHSQASIIRDSEVEEVINLVVASLKESSGIKDLKNLFN